MWSIQPISRWPGYAGRQEEQGEAEEEKRLGGREGRGRTGLGKGEGGREKRGTGSGLKVGWGERGCEEEGRMEVWIRGRRREMRKSRKKKSGQKGSTGVGSSEMRELKVDLRDERKAKEEGMGKRRKLYHEQQYDNCG